MALNFVLQVVRRHGGCRRPGNYLKDFERKASPQSVLWVRNVLVEQSILNGSHQGETLMLVADKNKK